MRPVQRGLLSARHSIAVDCCWTTLAARRRDRAHHAELGSAGRERHRSPPGTARAARLSAPLTGGSRAREWTAYLDCNLAGTDADTAVGQLHLDLGCTGVTVASVPHTVETGLEDPGRYGAVQMSLYGPLRAVRSPATV